MLAVDKNVIIENTLQTHNIMPFTYRKENVDYDKSFYLGQNSGRVMMQ